MTDDLNPNAVAASVVSDLIKVAFENTVQGLTGKITSTWKKVFEDFDPFMRESYQKNRYIRILCKKDQDVDLYDVYVKSYFSCNSKSYSDEDVIQSVRDRENIVVVGNGGAGKTCFMRHLWLTIFQHPQGLTPLFLELRKMNELTSVNLKSFIRASISRTGLSEELFDYFCRNGRFCFVLDGFDEVTQARQSVIEAQITDLSLEFPECPVVVSSRDDSRFSGWQNFSAYESNPLTLDQTRELVKKVPFHDETRKLFLKQLTKQFFEQNRTFLENPLLTVMMLMTFKDNMETPSTLSIFYDQALGTLHQWHDSTKSFKREKTLDIDQFRRSFGMFCLISYFKQMFEFTASEIHEIIVASNKANGFVFEVDDILWDYEKAVNLIRQDGLMYVFIHRSFQEYFAALAMTRFVPSKFPDLLPLVLQRTSDSVLQLCFELDRDLVVTHFIERGLQELERMGFAKPDSNSGYRALERSGAEFVFAMRRDKGKYHPSSLGAPISAEVSQLYANFGRVMQGSGIVIQPLHESLLDSDIFNSFADLAEVATTQLIRVRFESGQLVIEVGDEGPGWAPASSTVVARLALHSKEFSKLNRTHAAKMRSLIEWGSKQVTGLAERGKSLEVILDL